MKQAPMIAQSPADIQHLASRALPPMLCQHCGRIDAPRLGPGTGPHVAAARCSNPECGHFIKWIPKALVQSLLHEKDTRMAGGVNRVVLLGMIGKYGIEVRYATSGAPCASFMLVVTEVGADGKEHPTLIPCECWGKKAEAASELEAGQLTLFEGKLARRRKGEQWELVVSGFEVTPVLAPTQALTGSGN